MKRILIRIGGVILLIFSNVVIMFPRSFFWGDLHLIQSLIFPLLFFSGIALSSDQKLTQKVMIFSYALVLGLAPLASLMNRGDLFGPHFGPQMFIFMFIPLFFIIVLTRSGEEFKE